MSDPWTILLSIVAVGVAYVLLPVVADAFFRFREKRALACPETGARANVAVDAKHAALTAAFRRPRLRVKACSLWPERQGCEQSCLSGLPEGNGEEPVGAERRETALRQ